MLELKNICKSYTTGDFTQVALDDISINFRDSEFVAVLGPSGSGKTTLLNVIGGLVHYDSGDLIIGSKSSKEFKSRDWDHYRNNQVGFVFQNYNLIPHQSVLSNVELALSLSGMSPKKRKAKAIRVLKEVGLQEHIHKKPNQLSGGQQQRVAIARAIVNDSNIVFADEPTGALDTTTSIQIMEILKKISKDRLVVMVTHNPDLANDYATRIVQLKDAKIISDSNPIKEKKQKSNKVKAFEKGKTAMSFVTALSLSFTNLLGKFGRTFMTAFAGSIGIIGISAILALSTGTNQYIKNVEGNSLSQYPLTITRSKSLLNDYVSESQDGTLVGKIKNMTENHQEENTIGVRTFMTKLLTSSGYNDLKSFTTYIKTNPNNLNSYADSIEYAYSASPLIYSDDASGVRELYPNDTISSFSGGANKSTSARNSMFAGSGGSMSSMTSTSGFSQLPENKDIYNDKYTVAAGRWPQNKNECVMVLHQDGSINDTLLYTLGIRDNKEIEDALQNFSVNQKVDLPKEFDDVSFKQILGAKFKIVDPGDLFTWNTKVNIWEDKRTDKDFVSDVIKTKAENLEIVGIILPPEGSDTALPLTAGINYLPQLSQDCISKAAQSQIVKDQLATPDVDVLTGKTFAEEKEDSTFGTDILGDLFDIDVNGFKNAFNFDMPSINPNFEISQQDIYKVMEQSLSEEELIKIVSQVIGDEKLSSDVKKIIVDAVKDYLDYKEKGGLELPEQYFSKDGQGYNFITEMCMTAGIDVGTALVPYIQNFAINLVKNISIIFQNAIMQSMSNITQNLSAMKQSFSINPDALSGMFKLNLTKEKLVQISALMSGSSNRSYESNLTTFGYSDISNPTQITIYPSDFYAKDKIANIIDQYNSDVSDSGSEDKAISYTDYAKLLMSSITTMIDMITAVLVAFVGISLIVSSIMIGIITYISVLERRREIGILRAIGARKLDIFNVFNAETFIVGFLAGLIGIIFTAIACIPANILARIFFDVQYDIAILPFWAGIVLIVISVGLTMIAGIIPSSAAAKKDPVEAINS